MIRLAEKYADRPPPNCRCCSSASCPTPRWTGSGARRCAMRVCGTVSDFETTDEDGDFDILERSSRSTARRVRERGRLRFPAPDPACDRAGDPAVAGASTGGIPAALLGRSRCRRDRPGDGLFGGFGQDALLQSRALPWPRPFRQRELHREELEHLLHPRRQRSTRWSRALPTALPLACRANAPTRSTATSPSACALRASRRWPAPRRRARCRAARWWQSRQRRGRARPWRLVAQARLGAADPGAGRGAVPDPAPTRRRRSRRAAQIDVELLPTTSRRRPTTTPGSSSSSRIPQD